MVFDVRGAPLRAFPLADGRWRLRADVDRIDPAFVEALIAIEDQRFHAHVGVDPLAVGRAIGSLLGQGRVVSGASTISMQTARLIEPRPRNLGSKVIEAIRAVQLEARLSKRALLELYLTLTPYGGNLEGVRAASLAWFGKEPERLAPEEIALLIALPQAPEARRPDRRPEIARAARGRVLMRMAELGLITPEVAAEAQLAAVPGRSDFPARAWHAADQVLALSPPGARRNVLFAAVDVRTTLDAGLQGAVERLVREHVLREGGQVQASALVVEAADMAVRASIGSAGRDLPGGWIDLTRRLRSPGSTLKPFIYALAFEDGLAGPSTRIDDLPRRFGRDYRPENFDRGFSGEVTIAQALQHSLNVPAVLALDAVGASRFAAQLSLSGVRAVVPAGPEGVAGLSLALGGVGMSAQDLAVLYGALATDGQVRPLVWQAKAGEAVTPAHRLMSPETAASLRRILAETPTPQGRIPGRLTTGAPDIAFKTGTSYGFRDLWAAGIGDGHVVIVWVGRADGGAQAGETGRSAALPLLFQVFDAISAYRQATAETSRAPEAPVAASGRLQFEAPGLPPVVLFPPEGAELLLPDCRREGRCRRGEGSFVLAGRGAGRLSWYVDGEAVGADAGGQPLWEPAGPGFYAVEAVDPAGRRTRVRTRVITGPPRLAD
jgi:penicillin-binding protein 1C